jgi:diguanylate cyclase (GGDEF)-like protein
MSSSARPARDDNPTIGADFHAFDPSHQDADMSIPLRVLFVEDCEEDAALVLRELRAGGFDPTWKRVDDVASMAAALERDRWDIVISDHHMPRFSSDQALSMLREQGLDLPFLVVSGSIDEDDAVAKVKAGANDFIMKDHLGRLVPTVSRELRDAEVRRKRAQAEEDRRRAEDTIVHMGAHDALTGLLNRTGLESFLLDATKRAALANRPLALLKIGLNNFESLQDTFGPENSDGLLKDVARRLTELFGDRGTTARIGVTDFGVVVPDADAEFAAEYGRRVLQELEPSFSLSEIPVDVDASIGIAVFPGHGDRPQTLFRAARVARRYARKADCGLALFRPEYDPHDPKSLLLLPELRTALASDQLFLEYQPAIDVATKRVTSAEALVRWRHPERGVIPPDQFILLAEGSSLIKDLTKWVLKEGCRQWHAWRMEEVEIAVAVNLSARDLHDQRLADRVRSAVDTWGLKRGALELEITESALMADPQRARDLIERLTAEGIRFAIDDFGTGYSSFNYLRELPVQKLKIDKSIVKNISSNSRDAALVRGIIDLGHNLGLKVLAEGVEDQPSLESLASMGCDLVQGYHTGRPMGAKPFRAWLRESPWGLTPLQCNLSDGRCPEGAS